MANTIKLLRALNDLSQEDVAKYLNRGIAWYNRKENNPEQFTIAECRKLGDLFKMSPIDIFFNEQVTLKVTKG